MFDTSTVFELVQSVYLKNNLEHPTNLNYLVEDMEKLSSSIKRKYCGRLINRQEQWPPCHGEKLIRLELVKRKRGDNYIDGRGKHRSGFKELKDLRHNQSIEDNSIERIPIAYNDLYLRLVVGSISEEFSLREMLALERQHYALQYPKTGQMRSSFVSLTCFYSFHFVRKK